MSAMWLLQRRRVEQPAVDPLGGWLVIALDSRAAIAVSPSASPGLARVGGQDWRVFLGLAGARFGDDRRAQRFAATGAAGRLADPTATGAPS